VDDSLEIDPDIYLTKTEAFVVHCRSRGMSHTAIRRLLQLSAAEAVALGLVPAQGAQKTGARTQGGGQVPAGSQTWPLREGRCRPFQRRRRRSAYADRMSGSARSREVHLLQRHPAQQNPADHKNPASHQTSGDQQGTSTGAKQ
jgi:hypothetical protein